MTQRSGTLILTLTTAMVIVSGCTTLDPYTREEQTSGATKGALIGAGIGAVVGLISGDDAVERRQHALIGAGIGALAGGAVGAYQDKQEAALRAELEGTGVSVTRIGDNITLNMPGNVTFATDSSDLSPAFFDVLNSVGKVLGEFENPREAMLWEPEYDAMVEIAPLEDGAGAVQGELADGQPLRGQNVADDLAQVHPRQPREIGHREFGPRLGRLGQHRVARCQPAQRRAAVQQRLAAPERQHPRPIVGHERGQPRRVAAKLRRAVKPRSPEGHLFAVTHARLPPDRSFLCHGGAGLQRVGRGG